MKNVEKLEDDEESTKEELGGQRSNRPVTDGQWRYFFIFIFVICIASRYYAIYYDGRPSLKTNSGNITATKNETEITRWYFWGKNWLFDLITCNLAFISNHFQNSGWIVIVANVFLSIGLIIYSLSLLKSDYFRFHSQLDISLLCLTFFSLIFRLLPLYVNYFERKSIIDIFISPSHEKLSFWLMPEVIVTMIWYTKKMYAIGDDSEMRTFKNFKWVIIPFTAISLMILCSLYIYTLTVAFELGWNSKFSYLIIGGSCYIGLTIFYFLSMVICATEFHANGNVLDFNGGYNEGYIKLLEAFVWVGRYHFGTACYHATLILPRVNSLFVMNEPEFKKMPKFAKVTDRLYITHCKLHDLTLMSTAMFGTNHSQSLRKMLFHYAHTELKEKIECLQGFRRNTRSLIALLISSNNLMIILFWFYGLDDPSLSLAAWAFYLRLLFIFKVSMTFCDMASDSIILIRHIPSIFYNSTTFLEND